MNPANVFCTSCGSSIHAAARFCDKCGAAQLVTRPGPPPPPAPPPPGSFRLPFGLTPAAGLLGALVVVISVALIVKVSTGDDRSPAAVCKVFETEGAALHDRFQKRADLLAEDPNGDQLLGSLGDLLTAPSRLSHLMSKMAAVAPKDIEPAFSALAEAFKKVGESAGENATNPLGALTSGLTIGAQVQGDWEDANRYLGDHCKKPG